MVVVNSTVGITALQAGIPTIALGCAFYAREGLTHLNGLDSFWDSPSKPDRELVSSFIQELTDLTQMEGSFDGDIEMSNLFNVDISSRFEDNRDIGATKAEGIEQSEALRLRTKRQRN